MLGLVLDWCNYGVSFWSDVPMYCQNWEHTKPNPPQVRRRYAVLTTEGE